MSVKAASREPRGGDSTAEFETGAKHSSGSVTDGRLLDAFKERCEERALLVCNGLMDFIGGVDGLQAAAIEAGLVKTFGQNRIQQIMSDAFHPQRGSR
jgi:hypothetical protein